MVTKKMEAALPRGSSKSEAPRGFQTDSGRRAAHRHIKQCRVSRLHLSLTDAQRLLAAVQWGAMLWQEWRGLTVNTTLLNSPAGPAAIMRALADHLRHWQAAREVPPLYAWVRECGGQHGDHAHMLVAIPPGGGRALSHAIRRWLQGPGVRGDAAKGALHSRPTTIGGWLAYTLKTMTPADAQRLYLECGFRVIASPPAAPVVGQRIGIARALQQKARNTTRAQYGRNAQ